MQRIKIIDYMKALFIALVIVGHTEVIPTDHIVQPLIIAQAVPGFMILSGYTFALTSDNKSFREMYGKKRLVQKACKFIIPALITYMIYLIGWFLRGTYSLTSQDIVYRFIMGLYGPGGYYCGIMLQFIIIAPILYVIVKRYHALGVAIVGIINLLFEIMGRWWSISEQLYRVLIFRYLLLLAWGMYIYLNRDMKINKIKEICIWLVGVVYLTLPYFTEYQYQIFKLWSSTSMMAALYMAPMMNIVLKKHIEYSVKNGIGVTIENIGKASYHIMYVQLLYFVGVKDVLYKVVDLSRYSGFLEVVFAVVLCVAGGCIYYKVDSCLSSKIYNLGRCENI